MAAQKTEREHYTGVRPDIGTNDDIEHLANPAYGNSLSVTKQVGLQLNHNYDKLSGNNILTIGSEFISDNVIDKIDAYNHLVDQKVRAYALFFQSFINFFFLLW